MPKWRILTQADFDQIRKRARELLRAYRLEETSAQALFEEYHPHSPANLEAKLADAQLVYARAHDYPSWQRLKRGVMLFNAICSDDADEVLEQVRANPALLTERVNGVTSNWGPPLACAAQVGSARVFEALLPLPGQDFGWALDRAVLKGRTDFARKLLARGTKPPSGAAMGPCETLNVEGLKFLVEAGVPLTDEMGDPMAPVAMILEGYARNPQRKHACLTFFAGQGIEFPDTPVMALHRGRIDLLEQHLNRDTNVIHERFSYRDIYPLALGCYEDESLGLHGTPLDGATLLHMCMDFDEIEIARWLIERGADVNADAVVDPDGFGGHTPLFNAVVSQANLACRKDAALAALLLSHGADIHARASIRKSIRFHDDESLHEYRNVTPLGYGRAFHGRTWVNDRALKLIEERGGRG